MTMKSFEDPGLKLLLLASVCINLLLFGIVMGHVTKVLDSALYGQNYRIERIGKLSEASRTLVNDALNTLQKNQKTEVEKLYTLRMDIEAALASEPFDQKKYEVAANEYTRIKITLMQGVSGVISALSDRLTAHERAVLADLYRLPPRAQPSGHSSSKAVQAK